MNIGLGYRIFANLWSTPLVRLYGGYGDVSAGPDACGSQLT